MKRIFTLTLIVLFLATQNTPSLYAQKLQNRTVLAKALLEEGKTKFDITIVRLSADNIAAIVNIPIKSKGKDRQNVS